jgi:hypothetical protein
MNTWIKQLTFPKILTNFMVNSQTEGIDNFFTIFLNCCRFISDWIILLKFSQTIIELTIVHFYFHLIILFPKIVMF